MNGNPVHPDDYNRLAKLLVDSGDAAGFPEALALLATYRLQIYASAEACRSEPWQAALATAVNAGARAVHGGVLVIVKEDQPWLPSNGQTGSLSTVLAGYGATLVNELRSGIPTIVFSDRPVAGYAPPTIYALAGAWVAGVGPAPESFGEPSVLAAVLAAVIAVGECFQQLRGFPVAGDRRVGVSLWAPTKRWDDPEAEGPPITYLPGEAWILGLGHLGQAYCWLLSLLPYGGHAGRLVLQDDDRLSRANRATSLLEHSSAVGTRKTRLASKTVEDAGWETALVELRYRGTTLYAIGEPSLLLVGVDNLEARRALDESGMPAIYDAGLGAGPDNYLEMAIRRLPSARSSRELWPEREASDRAATLMKLPAYRQLQQESGDQCGVELLAGRTVATAFVGATAACWVLGSVLRELHGGSRYELIGFSLRQPGSVQALEATGRRLRISTLPCCSAVGVR